MRRTLLTASAIAALLMALGGCGSDDIPTPARPSASASATPETATIGGGELVDALLQPDEVPAGYTVSSPPTADQTVSSSDDGTVCGAVSPVKSTDKASVTYAATGGQSVLQSRLARFDSKADAKRAFDSLGDALNGCTSTTVGSQSAAVEVVAIDGLPSSSLTTKLTFADGTVVLTSSLVVGPVIETVSQAGPSSPTANDTQLALVKAQTTRLLGS